MTLVLGILLDRLVGDPDRHWHPVAAFGRLAAAVERRAHADDVRSGALAWLLVCVPLVLVIAVMGSASATFSEPVAQVFSAVVIWAAIGWRSLFEHVEACRLATSYDDRRRAVGRIVGRNLDRASEDDLRAAILESLAENASDAVVAPLFWAVVAGPAGAAFFRIANTLDAMWGHRNPRYERFGKWAARVDDLACFLPARLTSIGLILAGRCRSFGLVWRDAQGHLSPNAGYPEAALAHALGIRLGGPVRRGVRVERRVWLGRSESPLPREVDLGRGIDVVGNALWVCAAVLVIVDLGWTS